MTSTIPRVDLTDPNIEPSDAELHSLMSEMMRGVRKRADQTQANLINDIKQAIGSKKQSGRQFHG